MRGDLYGVQVDTDDWEPVVCRWKNSNQPLFQNRIIRNFLQLPEHRKLLALFVSKPGPLHKQRLEEAFRRYYFEIRFVSYLTSVVRYRAIDFHRKNRTYASRMLCIFDQYDRDNGSSTLGSFFPQGANNIKTAYK